ncbi:hypothetical protein VCUG_01398 [Vavraia culicis subsp. floridensis]|uniref:PUM-HD domain-containing protein n=1 Tax=Vavraia culicis (isolate floridensis) TaxID=948595 RepID=L2GVJ2_VAVCU|nr:uncharacterized protein VCUG_01398 [Vavraia culicis subsp. floridensis]ELA47125.1 hypothetical protein VCUG_01398 [Vavraia culicis subsp. floridensis]
MEQTAIYLKDLDMSILAANKPTLSRVCLQIKPYITELSVSKITTDKIQEIVEICDDKQLVELSKRMKIENMIYHNLGSKVLEVFVGKGVFAFLTDYMDANLQKCFNDGHATFVVRKMIEMGYKTVITPENIEFEKECVLNTVLVYLRSGGAHSECESGVENQKVGRRSHSDTGHSYSLARDIQNAKKSIIKHVLKTLFTYETLTEMKYSFFLEHFVKIMGENETKIIFKRIKNDLQSLAANKYSNYMVQSFIEKYDNTVELVHSLDLTTLHENVIQKILLKLQSQRNDKMAEQVIKKYYRDLKSFLFINGCVNLRCLPVTKRLFIIKEHNMNINDVFSENFGKESFKGDIEIVRYYLMGNEETKKKNLFVKKMMNECWGKKGEEVLVWMSRCCDYETRKKILKQLRQRKKRTMSKIE